MSGVKVGIRMPPRSAFDDFERDSVSRLQAAALNATHVARGSGRRERDHARGAGFSAGADWTATERQVARSGKGPTLAIGGRGSG